MEIKAQKSKSDSSSSDTAAKAPGLMDIINIDPLQQGQALQAASKKRKKQQKRAGLYKIILSLIPSCFVCNVVYSCQGSFCQNQKVNKSSVTPI